jgi:hypothetical protein
MDQSDETVTTAKEFNESLTELVRSAYENGVDIEGGWECRNPSENPDWDVMILEVTKRETPKTEDD